MISSVRKFVLVGLLALTVSFTAGLSQVQAQQAVLVEKVIIIPYYDSGVVHLRQLKGRDFDKALYVLLIGHEQAAMEMAKAVMEKSQDAQVKLWAQEILNLIPGYISTMENQLKAWKGSDPSLTHTMELAMAERIVLIRNALQPNNQYINNMIDHFQETIDMASLADSHSNDPEVKQLASEMIGVMRGEMSTYRTWLVNN